MQPAQRDGPPTVGYVSHEAGQRIDKRVNEILAQQAAGARRGLQGGEPHGAIAEQTLLEGAQATVAHGPAAARAVMTRWLRGSVSDEILDDARLLVTELVTNSLVHAETPTEARVHISVGLAG